MGMARRRKNKEESPSSKKKSRILVYRGGEGGPGGQIKTVSGKEGLRCDGIVEKVEQIAVPPTP